MADVYYACSNEHLLLILLREAHVYMTKHFGHKEPLSSTTTKEFVESLESLIESMSSDVVTESEAAECSDSDTDSESEGESDPEYEWCDLCEYTHEIGCQNRSIDTSGIFYHLIDNEHSDAGSEECVALYLLSVNLASKIEELASRLGKSKGDVTYAELEAEFL